MNGLRNRLKKSALLLFLLIFAAVNIPAQTTAATTSAAAANASFFASEGFPQWAKDLRRWEIVAFGAFPFTMFTATFAMDMFRWSETGFKDQKYAPWPIKAAGAIAMTREEQERTILIAAGLSVAVAFTDLIIVQIKRHMARKRAEAIPPGTVIITRKPWPAEPPENEAESDSNINTNNDIDTNSNINTNTNADNNSTAEPAVSPQNPPAAAAQP